MPRCGRLTLPSQMSSRTACRRVTSGTRSHSRRLAYRLASRIRVTTWKSAPGCDAIDTERGAKVSGSRFYFLTGVGAQLEIALVNLAMAQAAAAGLIPVIAPALVKPEVMEGTGFLGTHAAEVYHLATDDLYLVGTSEVALAGYHADEILDLGVTAAPLRGLLVVFPAGSRLVRERHPRHHPGALVRQGRDVLLHHGGNRPG